MPPQSEPSESTAVGQADTRKNSDNISDFAAIFV
jgi:hypothetical protein